MPTFLNCFFENNPDLLTQLVAEVLAEMAVANFVNEIPIGVIDGINTTFTLTQIPNPSQAIVLYLLDTAPGATLLEQPTDYTYTLVGGTTPTLELAIAPLVTQELQVSYYAV